MQLYKHIQTETSICTPRTSVSHSSTFQYTESSNLFMCHTHTYDVLWLCSKIQHHRMPLTCYIMYIRLTTCATHTCRSKRLLAISCACHAKYVLCTLSIKNSINRRAKHYVHIECAVLSFFSLVDVLHYIGSPFSLFPWTLVLFPGCPDGSSPSYYG